jgi:beta-lactam-binding protein with PASTA domain
VVSVLAAAVLAGGCGGDANRIPDVEGLRLDVAQERLDDADLGYEVLGGGSAGIVVRSNWRVCEQRPRAGKRAKSVELIVARSCAQPGPTRAVPHVIGLELDDAQAELARHGLAWDVHEQGLGDVVVESNWTVCDQWPYSGERAQRVQLYVEHFCDYDDDYDEDDDDDDDF